jgi:hypothetical protein
VAEIKDVRQSILGNLLYMFRVVETKYRKEWGDTSYGTSLRIVLGEAFPEAVPQVEEGIRLSRTFH